MPNEIEQNRKSADCWGTEREGYSDTPRAAYAATAPPLPVPAPPRRRGISTRAESRIGFWIFLLPGLIWFIYNVVTQPGYLMVAAVILPPTGPVGVTGIGILVWLHAKWRHSVRVQ